MKVLKVIVNYLPKNCAECAFKLESNYCAVKGELTRGYTNGGQSISLWSNARDENCTLELE